MFKAAKELRSTLIKNSLKLFLVSPLIRKFQVFAVRAISIGTLSKENIWLQKRKMVKLLETMSILYVFFVSVCITAMVENEEAEAGERRNY